ncbi:MAG: hypothetical protein E6590_06740 [Clostridiales bacterium]|nr:hypothetical protein [Clostridiales bacterium]
MNSNLFICTTPYDIFNVINLKMNIYKNFESDIIILNNFENSIEYVDAIKKTEMFKRVMYIKNIYKENFSKKITLNKIINRIIEIFDAHEIYGINKIKDYDIICCSYNERICRVIYQRLAKKKKVKIDLFEDGISSYLEVPFINNNKLHYIFNKKEYILNCLYLYNKELICWENNFLHKENIPKLDEIEKEHMYNIFKFNNKKYEFRNIIYLDQPIEELKIGIGRKDIADFIIKNINTEYLTLKMHPRQQNFDYDKYKFQIINDNTLPWEVMCSMINNKVIITFHSTAALTPLFLYNNNNKIIFLYKIFSKQCMDERIEKFLEKCKSEYLNKVFIPENEDDLIKIINKIIE